MASITAISSWPAAIHAVLAEPARVRPAFQPIFDLQRGVVCGFEMLARFESPLAAAPPEWFAAAAREGRGDELEALLVGVGVQARDRLPDNCFLAINVSPAALLSGAVQDKFAGRDLTRLVVEITEAAPVEDYDALLQALAALRDAGASIAVDDAGAGYASLSHVMRIRPEFIKLDRELIKDVDRDPAKHALVETFGVLAGRLDAWLIAEGIERPGEREVLAGLGVPLAQGFGLGRPAPEMAGNARIPAAETTTDSLADLVTYSMPIVSLADVDRFVRAPDAAPGHDVAVVADADRRPVGVLVREPRRGWRVNRSPLCTLITDAPADVAQRALTRARTERFDPLCCIDELGRLVGLIAFEQIVRRLANPNERSHP